MKVTIVLLLVFGIGMLIAYLRSERAMAAVRERAARAEEQSRYWERRADDGAREAEYWRERVNEAIERGKMERAQLEAMNKSLLKSVTDFAASQPPKPLIIPDGDDPPSIGAADRLVAQSKRAAMRDPVTRKPGAEDEPVAVSDMPRAPRA